MFLKAPKMVSQFFSLMSWTLHVRTFSLIANSDSSYFSSKPISFGCLPLLEFRSCVWKPILNWFSAFSSPRWDNFSSSHLNLENKAFWENSNQVNMSLLIFLVRDRERERTRAREKQFSADSVPSEVQVTWNEGKSYVKFSSLWN